MKKQIRVLIVEDSEDDAKLIVAELKRGEFEVAYERVETSAAMRAALERESWDLILCDFTMPYFSGDAALRVARQFGADVPFIYVSGTIGEDIAIEAMKSGAHDYVMKSNLTRLVPAIRRELQEAHVRRESRRAETAMRESEHKYRHLFEALGDAVFLLHENTSRILDTNTQAEALLGMARVEVIGSNFIQFLASGQAGFDSLRAAAGERRSGCELELQLKDGGAVPVQASASHIELYGWPLLLAVLRDVTERNRMEEQLRQLSRAMEQSPASVVITDTEANIRYVNTKFMALTGYSFNEVYGKNPRILKSGRVPPETYQEMWAAITTGKEWHGEFLNRKKSGELYWEAASISPIINEQGAITHFLAVKEDITERKRMEEALRQSQERYQALADNSLLGIAVMDTHYKIITVNATFADLFKKPAAEFVGKSCFNEFAKHPDVCSHCPGTRAMASQCTAEVETQGVRDDGSRFYVRNRAVPIFAPDGAVSGFIEIVEDIDRQKRAEQALRESEERHRLLFETSKDAFMTIAPPDWRFISVNPSTLTMFRARDLAEFLAKAPWDLSPKTQPDGQPSAEKACAIIEIAMSEGSHYFEWTHQRLDGELFPATVLLTRMELKGQLLLNACVRDITSLKRAEEALRDSEERFRGLVETSSDWIWETNEHMAYTYVSPQVRELLGYEPQELQGKTPFDFMPADEARRVATVIGPLVEQHQPIRSVVNSNRHKDGRLVVLETSGVPVFDATGAFRGYRGIDRDITERNRAVEALAFKHAVLQTQQETSLDGILVVDEHARFISFNQRFVEMWGLPPDVLATGDDSPALQFVLEQLEDPETFLDHVGYLYEHKNEKSREEIRLKSGKVFDRYSAPMVSPAGRYYGRVWFFRDITERKRTEALLQESEAKFRALFEMSWDAIMVSDRDGFIDCNEAAVRLFGYSNKAELLGKHPSQLSPPKQTDGEDSMKVMQTHIAAAYASGSRTFECFHQRKDGSVFPAEIVLNRVELNGQTVIQGVVRDITERKLAEEKIREQAALLDKAQDAIFVLEPTGRVTYWSQGATRRTGWTSAEAIGKNAVDLLFQGKLTPQLQECIKATQQHGEWTGELEEFTKDGRKIIVQGRANMISDDQGRPKAILIIDTDITEKKKLEAQFLRSQRMESLGTLASGIAHDLNNVLAPVLIALELIEKQLTDPEGQKLLETLETNVRRGAELIKQVLAFGRGMKGERIMVQPEHLAREIKQIVQETFPKSIEFACKCAPDLWTLTGDPTQIHQVLLNLCVNARDAMPEGGKLSLQMENAMLNQEYARLNPEIKPGPYIVITVRDTGVGIPRELQERIFEPFFTTKGPGKGSGLGLSTTLAIARSHGGFVHCYSELGKGSTFKVYLRADAKAVATETMMTGRPALPSGHNELVLVVDDELVIRQVAQQTLKQFGYRALVAANGAEGVTIYTARRHEIAAVITDMAMPVMDGPTMVAALKSINPGVKIIGSSGLSSGSSATGGADNGILRFISKPYTAEAMLRALHEILHPS